MNIRPPAVAGMFYPGTTTSLKQMVDALLAAQQRRFSRRPKALIAPHAGYIYSGATAAAAYAPLLPWAAMIERVVLLGPTHRVGILGMALPECDAFATPLGQVVLDKTPMARLARLPQVQANARVHAQEHSLEVHLPFLQSLLPDFLLVPLAVGQADADVVAAALEAVWGGPETLIVISSDLSHYLPYAMAQRVDADTCRRILALEAQIRPEQACGALPVNGLLQQARHRQLQAELLASCNSGDTAGERERVVGYAAFAFFEGSPHDTRH